MDHSHRGSARRRSAGVATFLALSAVVFACGSSGTGSAPASSVIFGSPTDYGCQGGGNVAVGDIDGDGHPDIAVGGSDGHSACLLFNQGDGTFTAPLLVTPGANEETGVSTGVAILDVNGDGRGDVFVASGSQVFLALGRPNHAVQAPVALMAFANVANHFSLGDVDGDGTPDVCANDSAVTAVSQIAIDYLGRGGQPSQRYTFYVGDMDLAFVADLNGDRRADLVGSGPGGVEVALTGPSGAPAGAAVYAVGDDGSGVGPGVFALDVNGDGVSDVVSFQNRSHVSVLLAKGDGTLEPPVTSSSEAGSAFVYPPAFGDLDGDGVADALLVTSSGAVLLHGSKDGAFAPWSSNLTLSLLATDLEVGAALADFDGDGRLDLAEGDVHSTRVFLRK